MTARSQRRIPGRVSRLASPVLASAA